MTDNEPKDEGITEAWLALAEQRMADVHAGKVAGIPAEEVLKSLPAWVSRRWPYSSQATSSESGRKPPEPGP